MVKYFINRDDQKHRVGNIIQLKLDGSIVVQDKDGKSTHTVPVGLWCYI